MPKVPKKGWTTNLPTAGGNWGETAGRVIGRDILTTL